MEKFNVEKIEKNLIKVAKENNIRDMAAVHLIINNMMIYNELLQKQIEGDDKKLYLLYQMSSTIFKQLSEFHLVPLKKDKKEKKDASVLENLITKVNKR